MIIKLTEFLSNKTTREILIGTESIIDVKPYIHNSNYSTIRSRGAMISTTIVTECVEEIYDKSQN